MSTPAQPGLTSVIVVAADSGAIVRDCVRRVLQSAAPVEVIVVDNASIDGEVEALITAYGERVRVLRNAANIGFGPACNRGADVASGDALLFLNPDCLIEADTIGRLRVIAAELRDAGLIGVRVEDADGVPERATRRRDPTVWRALMTVTGLARFESRHARLAGVSMPADASVADIERVDAVSGACLFLPREAFDAVAGFDEDYFLHCEDLDLSRRVRDSGRSVLYAATVRVRHQQGSSSRRRPTFVARHKHRGMWRYFNRFDPAARMPLVRALVWLGIWSHFWWREWLPRDRARAPRSD